MVQAWFGLPETIAARPLQQQVLQALRVGLFAF